MTNTTKAVVITLVNSVLNIAVQFGASLSDAQQVSIMGGVNSALALWVLLTYKNSRKRVS